jgi:hypothetical protein
VTCSGQLGTEFLVPHLFWAAAVSDALVTASQKGTPGCFMFYFGLSLYIAANILALVIAVKASS